ncbi:MAG: DUF2007 domain-containing protein [Candidatus Omnitrophota bacterium]|nr:MAG: DUF2007 domain-containing protein [Candidatus Omnitrophota bacterium]
MGELVVIKTFPYRHDAELARGLLESEGIKAIISADDQAGYAPHLLSTRGKKGMARLLVKKEDIEKAQEILKVLDQPTTDD